MKSTHRWTVVVAMAFMTTAVLASDAQPPHILVNGNAKSLLEPDDIEWVVEIRTRDKVPKLARNVNENMFESLILS